MGSGSLDKLDLGQTVFAKLTWMLRINLSSSFHFNRHEHHNLWPLPSVGGGRPLPSVGGGRPLPKPPDQLVLAGLCDVAHEGLGNRDAVWTGVETYRVYCFFTIYGW